MVNATVDVMQRISDQYYHWGGLVYEKLTVHILLVFVVVGVLLFICGYRWRGRRNRRIKPMIRFDSRRRNKVWDELRDL